MNYARELQRQGYKVILSSDYVRMKRIKLYLKGFRFTYVFNRRNFFYKLGKGNFEFIIRSIINKFFNLILFTNDKILPSNPYNSIDPNAKEFLKISRLVKRVRHKVDLVLILYLDHLPNVDYGDRKLTLGIPWAALLFHPRARAGLENEKILQDSACVGLGLFVKSDLLFFKNEQRFLTFYLPDESGFEPNINLPLPRKITGDSSGRIVVGSIGTITDHKNLEFFLDLMLSSDPAIFFFVMCGPCNRNDFSIAIQKKLNLAIEKENSFISIGYLTEDSEYDGVVASCDFLFAAYKDNWSGSANILEKARLARKNLIGNQSNHIGRLITEYGLGHSFDLSRPSVNDEIFKWMLNSKDSGLYLGSSFDEHSTHITSAVKSWLDFAQKFHSQDSNHFYALNNMDEELLRYLGSGAGFFVDVGANDGFTQSNTAYLERWFGWKGILIDPIEKKIAVAQSFRSKENHYFVCACVPNNYSLKRVDFQYANLMTTMKDTDLLNLDFVAHLENGNRFLEADELSYSFSVLARTLQSICDEVGAPKIIDFLSLDVEGSEMLVLNGIDHQRTRFRFILVETRDFEIIDEYLGKNGYKFISQFTENDYLYVDEFTKSAHATN
jgi:FkbM family methyltransferase